MPRYRCIATWSTGQTNGGPICDTPDEAFRVWGVSLLAHEQPSLLLHATLARARDDWQGFLSRGISAHGNASNTEIIYTIEEVE